jgi:hypothetical protein
MNITPLHAVTDTNKLATIADDMKKNGWTGNPVLIQLRGKPRPFRARRIARTAQRFFVEVL